MRNVVDARRDGGGKKKRKIGGKWEDGEVGGGGSGSEGGDAVCSLSDIQNHIKNKTFPHTLNVPRPAPTAVAATSKLSDMIRSVSQPIPFPIQSQPAIT